MKKEIDEIRKTNKKNFSRKSELPAKGMSMMEQVERETKIMHGQQSDLSIGMHRQINKRDNGDVWGIY